MVPWSRQNLFRAPKPCNPELPLEAGKGHGVKVKSGKTLSFAGRYTPRPEFPPLSFSLPVSATPAIQYLARGLFFPVHSPAHSAESKSSSPPPGSPPGIPAQVHLLSEGIPFFRSLISVYVDGYFSVNISPPPMKLHLVGVATVLKFAHYYIPVGA